MNFKCYHCESFETDNETEYLKHGAINHLYKPLFPNRTELELLHLKPQNKRWEKPLCTEEEAVEHLSDWVEKKLKEEDKQRLREGKPLWQQQEVQTIFHWDMDLKDE